MTLDRPPGPIRWELHTRPDGDARAIVRLDLSDAATYRRLVLPFAGRVERSQGPGSFANRTDRSGRLLPVQPARRRWRTALERAVAARPSGAIVVSDVRACYASIDRRVLLRAGIDETDLLAFLAALERLGVPGLPVGPPPSAILANAVLGWADAAVRARTGVVPIRWVDDVVFVAEAPSAAVRAFDVWRRSLASLGLEPNDAKTVRGLCAEAAAASVGRSASLVPARSRAIIAPP